MALQFVFGNSGCGKTHYIQEQMIKRSSVSPNKNFLVIVPEQFTMQTQRKLVELHPGHSILNIDVLSFARLAYRVFDELGNFSCQVLEDTGKNLILRRVAEERADALTVLRKNMARMGYIGEVKSLLSELAQYNISPSQLAETIEQLPQGSFAYKLSDILTMYEGFLDALSGRFVTAGFGTAFGGGGRIADFTGQRDCVRRVYRIYANPKRSDPKADGDCGDDLCDGDN